MSLPIIQKFASYLLGSAALLAGSLTCLGSAHADPASPEGAAAIWEKWNSLSWWERALCSIPAFDPQSTPDNQGAYAVFFNGAQEVTCAIYWSPPLGAYTLLLTHLQRFAEQGYEGGIGYPEHDALVHPYGPGLYQWFLTNDGRSTLMISSDHHTIHDRFEWSTFTVTGDILESWQANGLEEDGFFPASQPTNFSTANTGCYRPTNTRQLCTPAAGHDRWQEFVKFDDAGNRMAGYCACYDRDAAPGARVSWLKTF